MPDQPVRAHVTKDKTELVRQTLYMKQIFSCYHVDAGHTSIVQTRIVAQQVSMCNSDGFADQEAIAEPHNHMHW